MYAYVDQSLTHLCRGARFLMWAMRGWTHATGRGNCPPMMLRRGFADAGALPALADFHIAMAMLNSNATQKIHFAPLACDHVAEDEAMLLSLWQALSDGQDMRVELTLARVAPASSARLIARAMAYAQMHLDAAGLTLVPPQTHPARK